MSRQNEFITRSIAGWLCSLPEILPAAAVGPVAMLRNEPFQSHATGRVE
jgi:hypothetical protein